MASVATELENVYRQYNSQLFGCAIAVTSCGSLAEDAVHNAFVRAFKVKKCPDNPKAYMFRAVRNAAIDLMRRQNRTEPITAEMVFAIGPEQLKDANTKDQLELVAKALRTLKENERETILQHLAGHLTFQEISDTTGTPMGTVTSWYRRGIEKLKKQISYETRSV